MGAALVGNLTGGDNSSYYRPGTTGSWGSAANQAKDVPSYNIPDSSNYSAGVGYTPYKSGFTKESKPDWMTGWFDMPQWGTDVQGNDLSNSDLTVQKYEPPPPPQQQQAAAPQQAQRDDLGLGEKAVWANYLRDRDIYRNTQARLGAGTDDYSEMAAWNQYGGPWGAAAARDKFRSSNEYKYKPKSQWTMFDQIMANRGRR